MTARTSKAKRCQGCGEDLPGRRRLWCSERCRKKTTYGGTCESCGAPTAVNRVGDGPARHCATCAPAANTYWTRERIIEAIQEWARLYGQPPVAYEWNPTQAEAKLPRRAREIRKRFDSGEWPYQNTICERFGTWNAAIAAAGFTPLRPGGGRRGRP